jgi:hypothetical protein
MGQNYTPTSFLNDPDIQKRATGEMNLGTSHL